MVYRKFKIKDVRKFSGKIFRIAKNPILLKFENVSSYEILKEEDFINLFIGFIKLIKTSIRQDLEIKYKRKLGYYHEKIQELLSKIKQ